MTNTQSLRLLAMRAARAGGELALEMLSDCERDGLTVASKSSATDPVTAIDVAVEEFLRGLIGAERPSDAFLGEETGIGDASADSPAVRWIVDPIDGTVNLLYSQPFSAVSVAAEVDGKVAAGAVYAFRLGEMWSAEDGSGAEYEDSAGRVRILKASQCTELPMALVGTGFSYDSALRAEQGVVVAKVLPQIRDIRRSGSAALDLCMVASGRLDAYYERCLKPWDYAAGALIAREAGAMVVISENDAVPSFACAPGLTESFSRLIEYS